MCIGRASPYVRVCVCVPAQVHTFCCLKLSCDRKIDVMACYTECRAVC